MNQRCPPFRLVVQDHKVRLIEFLEDFPFFLLILLVAEFGHYFVVKLEERL